MEDEIIKRGPGRPRTKNTADALNGAEAKTAQAEFPVQEGVSSLNEENQEYMKQKSMVDMDVEAQFQQYMTTQQQGILPNIPRDPSYGYAWVTTNKTFPDNNIRRKLQGWHECSWDDVSHLGLAPGNMNTTRSADISEDLVSIQEMILMRIPAALRARIMKHLHHDSPAEKEENVYATAKQMIGSHGKNVMLEGESESRKSLALFKNRKADFQGA